MRAAVQVTAHLVTWAAKWGVEGNLLHNLFSLNELRIAPPDPTGDCDGEEPHWDNWTVPVMVVAWLLLSAAVALALLVRRRRYALFHAAHHLVWVFVAASLAHSWSLWFFLAGSLAFYYLDRAVRLWRGCAHAVEAVPEAVAPGFTLLSAPSAQMRGVAGQYVYVCAPALSAVSGRPRGRETETDRRRQTARDRAEAEKETPCPTEGTGRRLEPPCHARAEASVHSRFQLVRYC